MNPVHLLQKPLTHLHEPLTPVTNTYDSTYINLLQLLQRLLQHLHKPLTPSDNTSDIDRYPTLELTDTLLFIMILNYSDSINFNQLIYNIFVNHNI